ncbi:MAG: universal stress protein, partial [Chloroflexota bacterium]|nr:universal stress protein [Chloroflexota bacterium]
MRVLLATDGSAPAEAARDLVRTLAWPEGTAIRIVEVLPTTALVDLAPLETELNRIQALSGSLDSIAEPVRREGLVVECALLEGDSVSGAIVEDAARFRADVVVTGHRGHGPIASMLLGSVAAAVTDHAPCPVLVARRPSCARLLFAEDGSASAAGARRLLASWAPFRGLPVRVVSVAHVHAPLLSGIAPSLVEEARRLHEEMLVEMRTAHARLAAASAEDLRLAGLRADSEVRSGDPAEQVLAAASETGADLIVMGSRGQSG